MRFFLIHVYPVVGHRVVRANLKFDREILLCFQKKITSCAVLFSSYLFSFRNKFEPRSETQPSVTNCNDGYRRGSLQRDGRTRDGQNFCLPCSVDGHDRSSVHAHRHKEIKSTEATPNSRVCLPAVYKLCIMNLKSDMQCAVPYRTPCLRCIVTCLSRAKPSVRVNH